MRSYRSALVSAITTAILPVCAVYAADTTTHPQAAAAGNPQPPQAATARYDPPAAIPVESRSTGLKLNVGAAAVPSPRVDDSRFGPATSGAASFSRAEDALYGFPGRAAGSTGLKLTPAPNAPKPGWEVSGRVGPLRFLSPLDGEGETRLRLGGRVPGQPRMPGMGLFNVGIHYNFE